MLKTAYAASVKSSCFATLLLCAQSESSRTNIKQRPTVPTSPENYKTQGGPQQSPQVLPRYPQDCPRMAPKWTQVALESSQNILKVQAPRSKIQCPGRNSPPGSPKVLARYLQGGTRIAQDGRTQVVLKSSPKVQGPREGRRSPERFAITL